MSYTSYDEYLSHPEFRAVCNKVFERSGGICEWCGFRRATEPHHVQYCKWGEFDTELNLLHVCHKCHCDLHRCEVCKKVNLKAKHIKSGDRVCDRCRKSNHA
jgi:hypothetical protein